MWTGYHAKWEWQKPEPLLVACVLKWTAGVLLPGCFELVPPSDPTGTDPSPWQCHHLDIGQCGYSRLRDFVFVVPAAATEEHPRHPWRSALFHIMTLSPLPLQILEMFCLWSSDRVNPCAFLPLDGKKTCSAVEEGNKPCSTVTWREGNKVLPGWASNC